MYILHIVVIKKYIWMDIMYLFFCLGLNDDGAKSVEILA